MAAGQTFCPTVLRRDLGAALLPAQKPSPYRGESDWMPTSAWGKLGEHYCWVLKLKKNVRSCVVVKNKGDNYKFASRSLQK